MILLARNLDFLHHTQEYYLPGNPVVLYNKGTRLWVSLVASVHRGDIPYHKDKNVSGEYDSSHVL